MGSKEGKEPEKKSNVHRVQGFPFKSKVRQKHYAHHQELEIIRQKHNNYLLIYGNKMPTRCNR